MATAITYGVGFAFAMLRKISVEDAAVEAQCWAIGNVGFLGIPMLGVLMGPEAVGYIMVALALDLTVFGSLIVLSFEPPF